MWKSIEISFSAWFGDIQKPVKLHQIKGMGHIYHFELQIEGKQQGMLFRNVHGWTGLNYIILDGSRLDLTRDDVQALAERIEEALLIERLDITLLAIFGNEVREVAIFECSPWSFELRINSKGEYRRIGRIVKINSGIWTAEAGHGGWNYISGMDVPIIGDIIEEIKSRSGLYS